MNTEPSQEISEVDPFSLSSEQLETMLASLEHKADIIRSLIKVQKDLQALKNKAANVKFIE